jgi:hypothetical protein
MLSASAYSFSCSKSLIGGRLLLSANWKETPHVQMTDAKLQARSEISPPDALQYAAAERQEDEAPPWTVVHAPAFG